MNQRAFLERQHDAVVLGDIDAHLQRDVAGVAAEVLEVEPQLVDRSRAVDLVLLSEHVAIGVELHPHMCSAQRQISLN